MSTTRLTRQTARRGDRVVVTTREGKTLRGTLDGWGAQLVVVRPHEQTADWPWKQHSFAACNVTVERDEADPLGRTEAEIVAALDRIAESDRLTVEALRARRTRRQPTLADYLQF